MAKRPLKPIRVTDRNHQGVLSKLFRDVCVAGYNKDVDDYYEQLPRDIFTWQGHVVGGNNTPLVFLDVAESPTTFTEVPGRVFTDGYEWDIAGIVKLLDVFGDDPTDCGRGISFCTLNEQAKGKHLKAYVDISGCWRGCSVLVRLFSGYFPTDEILAADREEIERMDNEFQQRRQAQTNQRSRRRITLDDA